MGSNEEYLDNLLKSMSDDKDKEDSFMSSEEIEAMFAEAERVASGGSLEEELEMLDDAAPEPAAESVVSESPAQENAVSESVTDKEEESLPVPETEQVSEPTEESNADNEDLLSLLGSLNEDEELNEISELLQKSDNNEPVDEAILEEPEDTDIPDLTAETPAVSAVEPESTAESDNAEGKKEKKKRKKEKPKKEKAEKEPSEEKENKKNGLFSKLMTLLTEEEEEEENNENQAILQELDEEDKEAAKKKKKLKKGKLPGGKKGKDASEAGEDEEGAKPSKKEKKPKKEKKLKKVKEPKEKVVAIEEKPSRKISKKSIVVVVLFAATIFAVIFFAGTFLSGELQRRGAKDAYDKMDYASYYEKMYGMKLSEEEKNMFEHAEIVLKMQRRLSVYEKYLADDKELEALDSLMRVVESYDDIYAQAQTYGAAAEVADIYDRILEILESRYGLTEAEARAIAFTDSNVEYTRYLTALTNGESLSVGGGDIPSMPTEENEDILPEEEELNPPDFAE